jgi:hypothetical protein
MVYAYYDTYKSEYIVLGSHSSSSNYSIYGTVTLSGSSGTILVDGISVSGSPIDKGETISLSNPLNFSIPSGCTAKGVAMQFEDQ